MALLLAGAAAVPGMQSLPLAGLSLVVAVIGVLLTSGWLTASAKLGQHSVSARRLTLAGELLILAPGIALTALGNYLTQNAGTPANPGTDGPFADGAEGLIALIGMTYVGGAVVVISLLLFSPAVRRGFRR